MESLISSCFNEVCLVSLGLYSHFLLTFEISIALKAYFLTCLLLINFFSKTQGTKCLIFGSLIRHYIATPVVLFISEVKITKCADMSNNKVTNKKFIFAFW